MAKVYVSSTFNDLRECRAQVLTLLQRMGHEDVAMDRGPAGRRHELDGLLAAAGP